MVADPMLRPVSVLPFCLPAYGEDKKLKFLSCQLCQGASVGGWCTDRIIFSQASVPEFPSDCVVGGQRCHLIASLLRLADENLSYAVTARYNPDSTLRG